jgi:hypothetical protein
LNPGAELRITLIDRRSVRGLYQHSTRESIVVNAAASQQTFDWSAVRSIQQKRAGRRGRNTLIGLAVGAGVGVTVGAIVDAKTNGDRVVPHAATIFFGSVGGIAGTVIGVAVPTGGWREVYRPR